MKKIFKLLFIFSSSVILAVNTPPSSRQEQAERKHLQRMKLLVATENKNVSFSTNSQQASAQQLLPCNATLPILNEEYSIQRTDTPPPPSAEAPSGRNINIERMLNSTPDEIILAAKDSIETAKSAIAASDLKVEPVVKSLRARRGSSSSEEREFRVIRNVRRSSSQPGVTPRSDISTPIDEEFQDAIIAELKLEIENQSVLIQKLIEEKNQLGISLNRLFDALEKLKQDTAQAQTESTLTNAAASQLNNDEILLQAGNELELLKLDLEEKNIEIEKLEIQIAETRTLLASEESKKNTLKRNILDLRTKQTQLNSLLALEALANLDLQSLLENEKQANLKQLNNNLNLAHDNTQLEAKIQKLEVSKNRWQLGAIISGAISVLGLVIYAIKNTSSEPENN